jgi:hypothetical protein
MRSGQHAGAPLTGNAPTAACPSAQRTPSAANSVLSLSVNPVFLSISKSTRSPPRRSLHDGDSHGTSVPSNGHTFRPFRTRQDAANIYSASGLGDSSGVAGIAADS